MSSPFRTVRLPAGGWTLADIRCGEVFHPNLGAEEEAEQLYLRPWGLEMALAEPHLKPLVVWDVGFGAAGNGCAVLRLWKKVGQRPLHLWSFDRDRDALRHALAFRSTQPEAFPWLADLPFELAAGGSEAALAAGSGERGLWRLVEDDFVGWIMGQGTAAHGPFLVMMDLYSPEASTREWSLEHWREVRRVLAPSARTILVFHSRSTAVRTTLLLAGFWVGRGPRLGLKEETTVAVCEPEVPLDWLGWEFLAKVRRSTHAAPFRACPMGQRGPIQEEDWALLRSHPQFKEAASEAADCPDSSDLNPRLLGLLGESPPGTEEHPAP